MTRNDWISHLWRMVHPVLSASAAGQLHARLPLYRRPTPPGGGDRADCTHLEAVGRSLAGLAPWLDGVGGDADEVGRRDEARRLAQETLRVAFDPAHPDRVNVSEGQQPIVDAAFVAHAILRAPRSLADALEPQVRSNLALALASTRDRIPYHSNWLLFAAMIEACLYRLGQGWDAMRVDYALRSHRLWYVGDGTYGDGPSFAWDYYNSFVIQPMLIDILATVPEPAGSRGEWAALGAAEQSRFTRAAAVQERLIGPDGAFPPIGRSLTYRCGAFQLLAQAALQHRLPPELPPAQVRCALSAVIRRTLDAPGTWDAQGWLRPGLCGHQPGLMEQYISTGSLYLASTAFLPLGLPPEDPFWSGPALPWTQQRIWTGEDLPADHSLHDR